jgi:hypothetical protein
MLNSSMALNIAQIGAGAVTQEYFDWLKSPLRPLGQQLAKNPSFYRSSYYTPPSEEKHNLPGGMLLPEAAIHPVEYGFVAPQARPEPEGSFTPVLRAAGPAGATSFGYGNPFEHGLGLADQTTAPVVAGTAGTMGDHYVSGGYLHYDLRSLMPGRKRRRFKRRRRYNRD